MCGVFGTGKAHSKGHSSWPDAASRQTPHLLVLRGVRASLNLRGHFAS